MMNFFRSFTRHALQGNEIAEAGSQGSTETTVAPLLEPLRAADEPPAVPPFSQAPQDALPAALLPGTMPGAGVAPGSKDASAQSATPQDATNGPSRTSAAPVPPRRRLPQGLMDLPELRQFLDDNHFGLGRHNGINFRTADAREHGVRAIVCKFQNIVALLSAQSQVQIDRLNDSLLETEGICDVTTKRLQMAVHKCEREMATLQEQLSLANEGRGWVQQPIANYKLGFSQGVKAALDAEHLGF